MVTTTDGAVSLPTFICRRCGHVWHPRKPAVPLRCAGAGCKSPYWKTPKPKRQARA